MFHKLNVVQRIATAKMMRAAESIWPALAPMTTPAKSTIVATEMRSKTAIHLRAASSKRMATAAARSFHGIISVADLSPLFIISPFGFCRSPSELPGASRRRRLPGCP